MNNPVNIQLNQEQTQVVEQLHEFYNDPKKQLFQINAPAGTGKTTLIGVFLEELLNLEDDLKIVVCAYTNKAKKVLQRSSSFSNIINEIHIKTIHQYFGSKQDYDDDGEVIFKYTYSLWLNNEVVSSHMINLAIVDEVSMVNEEQYNTFMSFLKLNPKLKIITLGDNCQLPPVEKNEKGKFVDKESLFYRHPIDATLNENMRNDNKELAQCNTELRKCINDKKLDMSIINKIKSLDIVKVVNGYDYMKHFKREFENKKFIQFLSFKTKEEKKEEKKSSLKNVGEFNTEIRQKLFNIKPDDSLDIRESEQLQVMKKFKTFEKSDIISVVSSRYDYISLNFLSFLRQHPSDRIFDNSLLDSFCEKLDEIGNHEMDIRVQILDIGNSIDNIVKVTTDGSSLQEYKEYMGVLKTYISSFLVGIRNFESYKNIRYYLWDTYHLYDNSINAPVQPYYANSIYMAQGSTYDVCVLNYKDFKWMASPKYNPVKFGKLLYVGLTRSKGITYLIL